MTGVDLWQDSSTKDEKPGGAIPRKTSPSARQLRQFLPHLPRLDQGAKALEDFKRLREMPLGLCLLACGLSMGTQVPHLHLPGQTPSRILATS